jgi:hypothetical protein
MIGMRRLLGLVAAALLAGAPGLVAQTGTPNPFAVPRAGQPREERLREDHPRWHRRELERRGERLERRGERWERKGGRMELRGHHHRGRRWERKGERLEHRGERFERHGERFQHRHHHHRRDRYDDRI